MRLHFDKVINMHGGRPAGVGGTAAEGICAACVHHPTSNASASHGGNLRETNKKRLGEKSQSCFSSHRSSMSCNNKTRASFYKEIVTTTKFKMDKLRCFYIGNFGVTTMTDDAPNLTIQNGGLCKLKKIVESKPFPVFIFKE